MVKALITSLSVCVLCTILVSQADATDFYKYSVKDHNGEEVSLEKYRGKVTLVVNVASLCGYTEATYRALTTLHDILSYGGHFAVLAFPCNQFGEQEPAEAAEVLASVTQEYGVEFPVFGKVEVVGEGASDAWRNLVEQSQKTPEWNFYKYLVGPEGEVLNAWGTKTDVEDIYDEIERAVKAAEKAAPSKGERSTEAAEESSGETAAKEEL